MHLNLDFPCFVVFFASTIHISHSIDSECIYHVKHQNINIICLSICHRICMYEINLNFISNFFFCPKVTYLEMGMADHALPKYRCQNSGFYCLQNYSCRQIFDRSYWKCYQLVNFLWPYQNHVHLAFAFVIRLRVFSKYRIAYHFIRS